MRHKTRNKFSKSKYDRGKYPTNRMVTKFAMGDNVVLKAEPAIHSGMYHPRFHGKVGIVVSERGKCYEIEIVDGSKDKTLIVHPVHLKKLIA